MNVKTTNRLDGRTGQALGPENVTAKCETQHAGNNENGENIGDHRIP